MSQSNFSITVNLLLFAFCLLPLCAQLIWLRKQHSSALFSIKLFCLFKHFYPSARWTLLVDRGLRYPYKHVRTPCAIHDLSGGWKGCNKSCSNTAKVSAVWSDSPNHCSRDGTAQWSRLYPGGNDGCAGHRLNSAHLKHFPTTSVRPGNAVSFDPFVNLNHWMQDWCCLLREL